MNLRQMTAWGKSHPSAGKEASSPDAERCLTLLAEGASLNMPEIDEESYKEFRANVRAMALQIPDRLPEDDKLAMIRDIVHEFENYRKGAEEALRNRLNGWRSLAATLLEELLASLGIDAASPGAKLLGQMVRNLTVAEDIQAYRVQLDEFLHHHESGGSAANASPLKVADRTTANDNASGLRGGGVAVEHLRTIMERGATGYVALFHLSCLEVIHERFGADAVQDCLMAVSAFLTHSLRGDDAIYHWSDCTLLAILQDRASELILAAELQRIASHNRDITINIGERTIMLRIPLTFDLTPISGFNSAEDLFKLSRGRGASGENHD